jgi:hypothetical protein
LHYSEYRQIPGYEEDERWGKRLVEEEEEEAADSHNS